MLTYSSPLCSISIFRVFTGAELVSPGAEQSTVGLITYSGAVEKLSEILRNNKDGPKLNSLLARNITIYLSNSAQMSVPQPANKILSEIFKSVRDDFKKNPANLMNWSLLILAPPLPPTGCL